jgi:hypothetical protein
MESSSLRDPAPAGGGSRQLASSPRPGIRTARARSGMPTVLDTHTWMFWVNGDRRLSRRARSTIAGGRSPSIAWAFR